MTLTTPRAVRALTRSQTVGTIARFNRENPIQTTAIMKTHLVYLNKMCDVKKPLDEDQIDFIAEAITSEPMLSNLTLLDFMIVMRRAIMGNYGEMFESLSPPKVLRWLRDYAEERAEAAGEMSREEAESYKGDPFRSRYHKEQEAKELERRIHESAKAHYIKTHSNND